MEIPSEFRDNRGNLRCCCRLEIKRKYYCAHEQSIETLPKRIFFFRTCINRREQVIDGDIVRTSSGNFTVTDVVHHVIDSDQKRA